MKKHIKPCNCDTCLKATQKLLDEQHERANDHYASLIADIHSKLKKIQILADQEQALRTDLELNNLLEEIKK